jgi:predicted ATPase
MLATVQRSLTLHLLGHPDRGLVSLQEAIRHTEQTGGYAVTSAGALYHGGFARFLRRDYPTLRTNMERLLELRARYDISGYSGAEGLLGVALVHEGCVDVGIARLREALAVAEHRRVSQSTPCLLGALAEALAVAGQARRGLDAARDGLERATRTGGHWIEAELRRVRGELLLQVDGPRASQEAEVCFTESLRVARGQAARWWELRTATSLARLWGEQGKRGEARELLAAVCGWFTEGFDTPDLVEANALLAELSS